MDSGGLVVGEKFSAAGTSAEVAKPDAPGDATGGLCAADADRAASVFVAVAAETLRKRGSRGQRSPRLCFAVSDPEHS